MPKKKAPAGEPKSLELATPGGDAVTVHEFGVGAADGCFMEPDENVDRPVGSWTDAQLGSYIRQTIFRGDVGLLLFVCKGQTWARRVSPPDA